MAKDRVALRSVAWKYYLVAASALSVAYFLLPAAPAKLVMWPAIGWTSVAAIILGVRLHRPDARTAWYLLAAGVATFVIGDNLYSVRLYVEHAEALFPSYVDIVYLAVYPLLVAGLVRLVRTRTPGRDHAGLLDAAIITCGVGLLSWVILIVPYVRIDGLTILERLTSIAYPLGDVALLAVAVRLLVGSGRRPLAFWLLAGSIVPLLAADAFYGSLNLTGGWHEHNPVDLGWIAFYVGWGTAALHPSMRELSVRAAHASRTTRRRLLVVGSAALIPPAVLFVQQMLGSVVDGSAIAITAAVLFALVLTRTAGLAGEVADTRNEARFRSLVNHASDAIIVVDSQGRIHYHAPSAARVLGRDASELLGQPIGDILLEADERELLVLLATTGANAIVEWSVRGTDGTLRDMEVIVADLRGDEEVGGVVLTMRDITERRMLDAELRRQALHDTLTGLPNRSLFNDRIAHALSRRARLHGEIAVMFLDLDDFKLVNDSLGHPVGDEILILVASRLASVLKEGDTFARLGGDEFAVLLEDGDSGSIAAEAVAARLQDALREPFPMGSDSIPVRASIGIAIGRRGTDTPSGLLRDADLAMYVAKRNGKARSECFAPEMHEQAIRRLEIASELRGAIDDGQLVLFYQPIVAVATGRTLGVEALVRWNHPRRGLTPPSEFIPIAESTGLVIPLGRWVLAEACRQTREWQLAGVVDEDFYVSVNLSARHLHDGGVVDDILDALAVSGLRPAALLVEVTESALVEDLDPTGARLRALKALGVRVALDDFGTGYSSLARLSTFPLDVVKIDKSFVDRVCREGDTDGEAMMRAVIDLSHTLGMVAIAEGVEQPEQAVALERLGCTMAQGYLFARPMPPDDFAAARRAQEMALAGQP
jgi:diguanylate cyclase (GGDEF)-like protein/PAS domain S-box-containing protein